MLLNELPGWPSARTKIGYVALVLSGEPALEGALDMDSPSFDQFAEFIREWGGMSRKKKISPESRLEDDLGITGDDGCDLLEATEKRFDVRLSSDEHGYRETFNLAPNEFLFHSEGLFDLSNVLTIFGRPASTVRAITAGELCSAVQEALKRKPEKTT